VELVLAVDAQPAVGVRDDHDPVDAEQPMREHEGAQDAVVDPCARVTEDRRVAGRETEHRHRLEPGVDTGEHGEGLRGPVAQAAEPEPARVFLVRRKDVVERVSPHVGEANG
jgi:hypothetical protein